MTQTCSNATSAGRRQRVSHVGATQLQSAATEEQSARQATNNSCR